MPEGHTLHRLAREQGVLVGQQVAASSPQGRFTEGAAAIDGSTVDAIEAYGKHLLHRYGDRHLHVHLGMRGVFLRLRTPPPPPRGQVRLRLVGRDDGWDLIAPMRCQLLDDEGRDRLLGSLGPDPLRPEADRGEARSRLAAYRGTVGAALLDQRVIAGIGNVVRTEALADCGINPHRPAAEIDADEFECLWRRSTAILQRAVELGRIVTVDGAEDGPEAEARHVYKQDRCRRCGTAVVAGPLAGRTAYHCPRCQER